MKTFFITRTIPPDSPLRLRLIPAGWTPTGFSLLEFRPLPVKDLPEADWLFFYSKNGVRFLLDQVPPALIRSYQLAAIGRGTAQALTSQGCPPHFTGTGDPATTAEAFGKIAKGTKVIFIQAKQSRRSIEKRLSDKIIAYPLAVYENTPKASFSIPPADLYVFTSPMNVQAFAQHHGPLALEQTLAIGTATAEAIASCWGFSPAIAPAPEEEAIAETILKLFA